MKTAQTLALTVVVCLVMASPLLAADGVPNVNILSGAGIGAGIGAALTIIGAGYGFGKIGSTALESMARQPEIATKIQGAMIVIAALLEGATFFALLVCLLVNFKATF